MWKMPLTRQVWKHHHGVVTLCPQCDALGPHPACGQAVACIDCGEWLGRLTPEAFIPVEPEPESTTGAGLERIEAERILHQVLQDAQAESRRQAHRSAHLLGLAL